MLLALRINVLAKGFRWGSFSISPFDFSDFIQFYSGIRPETVRTMLTAFNRSCLSFVPEQGTVGASGDLAPLSHLALGLMGKGKMWDNEMKVYRDAAEVLAKSQIEPIRLGPKEGLAMINGTQFITSLGSEALVRAHNLCILADIIGALTLEVLKGTPRAFDPKV